eukprot:5594467-Pleurochrysis_carterae.AAC.1
MAEERAFESGAISRLHRRDGPRFSIAAGLRRHRARVRKPRRLVRAFVGASGCPRTRFSVSVCGGGVCGGGGGGRKSRLLLLGTPRLAVAVADEALGELRSLHRHLTRKTSNGGCWEQIR